MPKTFYAVMKVYPWESVIVEGEKILAPADGPDRFISIFETYERAKAWASEGDVIAEFSSAVKGDDGLCPYLREGCEPGWREKRGSS